MSGVLLSAGPAADAQGQLKAMEKLAAEVEADSSIAGRSMWKWTCYQARPLWLLINRQQCHGQCHTPCFSLPAPVLLESGAMHVP